MTVNRSQTSQESLHCVISFTGVGRARVENNLPVKRSRLRVPIRRLSQVGNLLQVVHAVEVGKDLFGMSQKVWEDVVDVPCALQNVTEHDVDVNWEVRGIEAVAAEAGEGLRLNEIYKINEMLSACDIHIDCYSRSRPFSMQSSRISLFWLNLLRIFSSSALSMAVPVSSAPTLMSSCVCFIGTGRNNAEVESSDFLVLTKSAFKQARLLDSKELRFN